MPIFICPFPRAQIVHIFRLSISDYLISNLAAVSLLLLNSSRPTNRLLSLIPFHVSRNLLLFLGVHPLAFKLSLEPIPIPPVALTWSEWNLYSIVLPFCYCISSFFFTKAWAHLQNAIAQAINLWIPIDKLRRDGYTRSDLMFLCSDCVSVRCNVVQGRNDPNNRLVEFGYPRIFSPA